MMLETRRTGGRRWPLLPAAALLALCCAVAAQESGTKDSVKLADGTTESGLIESEDFGGLSIKGGGGKERVIPWKDVVDTTYRGVDEYATAVADWMAGRLPEAEAGFSKLAAQPKLRPVVRQQALFHLAVVLESEGKGSDAAATWRTLMTDFPRGRYLAAAAEALVAAKLAAKDAAGAAAELAKIEEATKGFADVRPALSILKGTVLEAQNKPADALAVYSAAALDAAATPEVKAAAELGKARCQKLDKKPADAEATLRKLVTSTDAPPRVLAGAWNEIGDILLEQGRASTSEDKLQEALFAYLRSSVQYLPLPGEPTRDYERALAGSARCFKFISEITQKPERKDLYNTRSRQRTEKLRTEFPGSEFLAGLEPGR